MGGLYRIGPAPRIAVEARGQGPLVVLLHGIGANRHMWRHQLDALAEDFTVAAWDARGYLDSDDYEGALRFEAFAEDLERVLDGFGCERAHLIGASMGGRIAIDFYARQPQRVASLVLADTSAGSPVQASPERIEEFLALRRKPLLEGKSPADIAPSLARTLVSANCPANVFEEAVTILSSLRPSSYLKTLETVTRFNSFPRFESVKAPTLVIVGEHDRIATPEYARQMADRIPGARFRILSGVGHLSNMENPTAFNEAVLEFLAPLAALASRPSSAPPDARS